MTACLFSQIILQRKNDSSIVTSNDETTDVLLDISKYEGHTPAPWRVSPNSRYKIRADENLPGGVHHWHIAQVMNDRGGKWEDMTKVNAQLIADAPLLLEEVKRQRKKIDALVDALETIAGDLVHVSSGEDVARIAQFADDMSGLI